MRLPSKVTPYRYSTLSKYPVILNALKEQGDMKPIELYKKVKSRGISVADFIEILDSLFLLGKIELKEDREVLHYAE